MKLKTLKDLEKDRNNYSHDDSENVKYFDERVLKAEAIKWVKEWIKYRKVDKKEFLKVMNFALKHKGDNWKDFSYNPTKSPNEDVVYDVDIVEFAIRFFNITEEELDVKKGKSVQEGEQ